MGEGVPLQAVIVADSITTLFEPIDLPLMKNTPMIDQKLAWLESANVEEVFVLCSSHSKEILEYLDKSKWVNKPNFSVTIFEPQNCISLRNMIKSDFILVSGDTVTNMMLTQALEEHKEKNAVMTMVIKQSTPCDTIMAIDPTTKQLLDYENKTDSLKFDNSFLTLNPCYSLHNDKQDCYIDICSPQVLTLFTDINVDYQHIRRDCVNGLLADGFKIFTHEIHPSYYAEFLINENFPTELELDSDIVMESKDEKFEKTVETIFSLGVEGNAHVAVMVSELQQVRRYYRMDIDKCAGFLLYLMMKLALGNSNSNSNNSGNDLLKETYYVISKWGGLVKPFSRGVDGKVQVILKLEEMCLASMSEYAPLFVQILYIVYVKNIIEEEAILKWAKEKEHDKVFVKQSQKFIQWLKELSSEEKYRDFQETDLKRLNIGGVQVKKSRRRTDLKRLNERGVQCLSIC
ncbi:hypothetical protein LXL04_033693 [Taraxacum kok-saghyz]